MKYFWLSLLKTPTNDFTVKNLLRHYAQQKHGKHKKA